jgi:hypothetical protein
MNAHDVRRLRLCTKCGGLGYKRRMLELPAPLDVLREGQWWHGQCFIDAKGIDALLNMPRDQIGCLALDDIGVKAMTAVLAVLALEDRP